MRMAFERAAFDGVVIDDIAIGGVLQAKFVTKRTQKEIIVDDDDAVRRMGTLQDADLSLTLLRSPGDPGQAAILASDRNNTQCEYVVVKGSIVFVAVAGVAQIGFSSAVQDENAIDVMLSTSKDIAILY